MTLAGAPTVSISVVGSTILLAGVFILLARATTLVAGTKISWKYQISSSVHARRVSLFARFSRNGTLANNEQGVYKSGLSGKSGKSTDF